MQSNIRCPRTSILVLSKTNQWIALGLTFVSLLVLGCKESSFRHELSGSAKPWTAAPEARGDDEFTFAIIGDLNGGERERIFEIAVEQLRLLKPTFILSIGDLIDGGTEDTAQLKIQYDYLDRRAAKAASPFFHLGGNHDLTNPVMRKYWEERYGRRYYHFIYENILFLMIDSEDFTERRMREIYLARKRAIELLDSGKTELAQKGEYFQMQERITGEVRDEQSKYFEKVIQENPNVRWTFLFMHKPVWQRKGEGSLERIEAALGKRNYTVFNGHLHNYSYTLRNDRDYIMMGTTGGGQNARSQNSFDHITLVTMDVDDPSIANIRLDGILDKTGDIPLNGDTICFQASKCDSLSSGH
jgi:hypothetical protein